MLSQITKQDYKHVVELNRALKLRLDTAENEAEEARKACRDLAAWTLWERNRLMRELEEMMEAHRAFIYKEVDQLIAEEASRLSLY
jgi:predicted component of viral defense system (DUF524 family)